jgi:hypothetical protein
MKKFLALAVLATTATSFAASDRAIYDIMYLPTTGTTFGISDLGVLSRSVKADDSDDDTEVSGYGLTQTIGHSFTERFALAASLNYTDYEIDPDVGSKSDISGISDPIITAKYRALDEDYALDFIATALISRGDSEIDQDGDQDNLQGGHALQVGVQYGHKAENFSWAVLAAVNNNFDRTYDVEDIGDIDAKSNNDYSLRADFLNKLAEKSFLRSHAEVEFQDALEAESGSYNILSSHKVYEVGAEYQHLCSANLLVRGGLDFTADNHDSGEVDSDNAATLNLGATYQF